jgi:hypothetical protein
MRIVRAEKLVKMNSITLPQMKKCYIILSLAIVLTAKRWCQSVHSFSWNSFVLRSRSPPTVPLQQQHQQSHIYLSNSAFTRLRYRQKHQMTTTTTTATTRSMALRLHAFRDPLIMMPSQTPMVPYKVGTPHLCDYF